MDILSSLSDSVIKIINSLFDSDVSDSQINIQPTRKEFEGDYTLVVFPLLKISKKGPEDTAKIIGQQLIETDLIEDFNVIKGFLNLKMSDDSIRDTFVDIWSNEDYGSVATHDGEVVVEFSSPNTNKPLHLGHLRNIFLGHSVSRINETLGNKVHKVQIINDRGIHICKSILAWKKFGEGETPESSGLKGDKLVGKYYVEFEKHYRKEVDELMADGIVKSTAEKEAPMMVEAQDMLRKWEARDPEVYKLWQDMNGWVYNGFDETYATMGVSFDKLYYESDTYLLGRDEVQKGLDNGVFFRKDDGSVWVDLTEEGLDEKILLRADGTSVYMTQDLGTATLRYNDFPGLREMIYTVGNEQDYHFKVLFMILGKLGYEWASNLYHLSYGMVDLPTGKMKSREGTVVDADDIMAEMVATARKHTEELGKIEGLSEDEASKLYDTLGLGALKYFLLKVDPRKRMLFNPEESIQFHGNTGPFIQYTHARISAILRKAKDMDLSASEKDLKQIGALEELERSVVKILVDFPQVIMEAATEHSPSIVAQYVYELAKEYNRFYQEISIFNEEDETKRLFRIAFSDVVARTIRKGMWLLGIEVPERM